MNIWYTYFGSLDSSVIIKIIIQYKYWIIFPIACVEGPILSILVGFLVSLGYINAFGAYATFLLGDLIPDTLYYYIGRIGRSEKILQRYKVLKKVPRLEHLWHQHAWKTMIFTKLAHGFSVPLLVTAGLAHLKIGRFLELAIPVSIAQYAVLMLVGYYFGSSYTELKTIIEHADFIVALSILLVFFLYLLLARRMRALLVNG